MKNVSKHCSYSQITDLHDKKKSKNKKMFIFDA